MQFFTRGWILLLGLVASAEVSGQQMAVVSGKITGEGQPVASASISLQQQHTVSDSSGLFKITGLKEGSYTIRVSYVGYELTTRKVYVQPGQQISVNVDLAPAKGTLNEIVVTGVSRATLIKENPVAIVSVSSKNIDKAVESNIIDALVKNVPGLNAVKTGPNISKPFIRGLGYNRVLTLYDGIRQEGQQWGDEHGIEVDAYNIAKAEVIKGPASLMFGSDAVAGVVSMFPHIPTEKDGKIHGRLLSEYQHNNGLIGNGLRLGYSDEHWLWEVKGAYRIARNYTNAVDGRVYNTGFKETNAGATVGYTSSKGTTTLNATLYNNLQGIPDGSRDSLTRRFTKQVHEGEEDDITDRPLVTNSELNSYTLSPLHQHIQHYRIYTNNHYKLGNGEVDATLGFQQNLRREYSHPTMPEQAGMYVRLNTINYGVRYTAPTFSNIEMTVGMNGMYQQNKNKDATDFPIPDYKLSDIGAYIYGKWKYEQLTVSGGIRYDQRSVRGNDFYVKENPTTGFEQQAFLPDTASATLQFPALHKNFNGVSLSIGAAYQLTDQISLKANVGRGYRSPNITEIASNGLDPGAHIIYLGNRNFVPEFSFQQDLGVTGQFRNVSASVSIFNNNIQNYIYLTQLTDESGNAITDAQGNRTFQYQQAAARLYGAEASLDIHPAAWKGFSFNNTLALTYGINKKKEFKGKGAEGQYLSLIPPPQYRSSISQEIATRSSLFSSVTAGVELEHTATQNRFLALYNTETATPGYTLINVSAGTRVKYCKDHTLEFQVQVNNLFDVAYQSHLSRLKYFEYYNASPNGRLGIYNMGRNISMKMIAAF
jgi:iron complex outermembrane receptor protein